MQGTMLELSFGNQGSFLISLFEAHSVLHSTSNTPAEGMTQSAISGPNICTLIVHFEHHFRNKQN